MAFSVFNAFFDFILVMALYSLLGILGGMKKSCVSGEGTNSSERCFSISSGIGRLMQLVMNFLSLAECSQFGTLAVISTKASSVDSSPSE